MVLGLINFQCDKADIKANTLHRGNGRWTIEKVEQQTFDENGTVTGDTSVEDIGEIIFFRDGSINALYDYYPAIISLTKNDSADRVFRIEYYTDGKRFDLSNDNGLNHGWLDVLSRVYTVEKAGRNKYVLISTTSDGSRPYTQSSLSTLMRVTLRKE